MANGVVRRAVLLMGSLALLGCVTQETYRRDAHQRVPENIAIYVVMSDEVVESDDGGSIATLVEALDDDLRERGHHPVIVAARSDEKAPVPRLELRVLSADQRSRGLRVAGGSLVGVHPPPIGVGLLAAGMGSVVVDWYVVQADSKVSSAGRVRGPVLGTDDDRTTSEAQRVGRSIVEAVIDG
jgi:hypothetical protein